MTADPGRTTDRAPAAGFPPPDAATPAALVAAARASMEAEWAADNRVPAAWYFAHAPALAADPAAALDLAYLEFVLREEAGDPADPQAFAAGYPALAARLRRLLSLDQALARTAGPSDPNATTVSSGAPPPADHSAAPTAIGRYLIVGAAGGGGQGDVFYALHPGLGREVVVKRVRGPAGGAAADRLAAEGRVLAALDHPNLARVYDLDAADGQPFVVMESVRGRHLADVRRAGPVAPADAARWVAAVARAAHHAHGRGVLHLDVKPRNVVLDETGRAVLIDFGLARVGGAYAPDPAGDGVSGTLAYMAPEQARGENDRVGPAADVYGLGGVLYHLLTGLDPVRDAAPADLFRKAREGDWDRAALATCGAPPALVRACERALARDPAARFPSAAALADALDAAVRCPRWRLPAAVAAVVALVAIVVVARPRDPAPTPPAPLPTAPPAVAPQPRPELQFGMRVYRPALKKAFDNPPGPFVSGEGVRFTGVVPPGHHAALLLVNEAGAATVLATTEPHPAAQPLAYPPGTDAKVAYSDLRPPAGTHVVLLAASSAGPVTPARLGLTDGEAWPRVAAESLLRVAGGKVEVVERGRDFGPARTVEDPEGAVRDRLTRLLAALPADTTVEGVVFALRAGR